MVAKVDTWQQSLIGYWFNGGDFIYDIHHTGNFLNLYLTFVEIEVFNHLRIFDFSILNIDYFASKF
jgi:hypothetical protein